VSASPFVNLDLKRRPLKKVTSELHHEHERSHQWNRNRCLVEEPSWCQNLSRLVFSVESLPLTLIEKAAFLKCFRVDQSSEEILSCGGDTHPQRTRLYHADLNLPLRAPSRLSVWYAQPFSPRPTFVTKIINLSLDFSKYRDLISLGQSVLCTIN
jgi:hypothetical protein